MYPCTHDGAPYAQPTGFFIGIALCNWDRQSSEIGEPLLTTTNKHRPFPTRETFCNFNTMRPNRSVVDFDSEEALRRALMAVKLPSDENNSTSAQTSQSQQPQGEGSSQVASPAQPRETTMEQEEEEENLDWVLPSLDPETSEVQSMKQELHRLQVLKSYMILDAEREESFERLTRLSARFYHVPITLISLVDLGRQWFISNRGLGDVRETPRKHAFCAHAILNKHNILVVPDASKDVRFQNNPLSTGPPNIRFYAGAVSSLPDCDCCFTTCCCCGWCEPLRCVLFVVIFILNRVYFSCLVSS